MNTRGHQNGETGNAQFPAELADQAKSVDESRRGFTKSGLALSGVLLTLASRPVLGDFVCKTPSGFLSGNVSVHGNPQTCGGLTPGYWGNKPENWPSPYKAGTCSGNATDCNHPGNWTTASATKFMAIFNCNNHGSIYSSYTLFQVIWLGGGGDPDQLGAHVVSALLNARSGYTPVLGETQLINMFNEWNQNGYFEPTAGVKWYGADIVAYLKTTMS